MSELRLRRARECVPIFDGHDEHEMAKRLFPAREDVSRARAAGVTRVLLHEPSQDVAIVGVDHWPELHHVAITEAPEVTPLIEDEGDATAHARGEVPSRPTEHDDHTARHIFAAVVADALDDRERTTISHGEALAGDTTEVRLAGRRTIQHGVADDHGLVRQEQRVSWRAHDEPPARESLAHVVVGFTLQLERYTTCGKG